MLQSVDLLAIEPISSDQQLLHTYLQQLVGQPFLLFRFSYGDELSLHFGSPQSYTSPRLKHSVKGSYIVAARASSWALSVKNPPQIVLGTPDDSPAAPSGTRSLTKQQLENSALLQPGARILAAEPILHASASRSNTGFALVLALSDGSTFFIHPSGDEPAEQDSEIADWEVFTPHERCLEVGPGLRWAYVESRGETAA